MNVCVRAWSVCEYLCVFYVSLSTRAYTRIYGVRIFYGYVC